MFLKNFSLFLEIDVFMVRWNDVLNGIKKIPKKYVLEVDVTMIQNINNLPLNDNEHIDSLHYPSPFVY